MPPQRVVLLRRFGLKTGIDFNFWVRFFGKIQIRISESKANPEKGSWIHKIHALGGFFGSNSNPDFWDSQSERFYGKGFEKSIFDKQFSEQKTRHYGRHNVIYVKAWYSRDNSLGQAVPETAVLANEVIGRCQG